MWLTGGGGPLVDTEMERGLRLWGESHIMWLCSDGKDVKDVENTNTVFKSHPYPNIPKIHHENAMCA